MTALCTGYYRRVQQYIRIEERELRSEKQLGPLIGQRDAFVVLLDEHGDQLSSIGFSRFVCDRIASTSSQLIFVIGAADGFSDKIKQQSDYVLSLSSMTMGHRLARVVLAEQLYRAVDIIQGGPYHRK